MQSGEQNRKREQSPQAAVHAGKRDAARLQEVALDPIQPCALTVGVGPFERRRQPGIPEQLARIAARRFPFGRCLREAPVHPPTLRVLLQPVDQPRPPLEQRLVHQLDGSVVDNEQPAFDQLREHATG